MMSMVVVPRIMTENRAMGGSLKWYSCMVCM